MIMETGATPVLRDRSRPRRHFRLHKYGLVRFFCTPAGGDNAETFPPVLLRPRLIPKSKEYAVTRPCSS